jgi:hypothetical protein
MVKRTKGNWVDEVEMAKKMWNNRSDKNMAQQWCEDHSQNGLIEMIGTKYSSKQVI